jgi:hypothetical protein
MAASCWIYFTLYQDDLQAALTTLRQRVFDDAAYHWPDELSPGRDRPCGCREPRPRRSSGVFVLVEDSAQAITPMDVKMLDRGWVGDRLG